MRNLTASKDHARRSAQVSALALIVAAVGASAPNAVAASPPGALAWAAQPPIPTARGCLASAVLDGNIYVVGGYNAGEASALSTVEAYDAWTKQWSTLTPMPTPRSCLGAASLDGKIYTIAGLNGAGNPVATVLSYAPASGRWQTVAPLLDATDGDAAVANAGHIYVVGGENEVGVVGTLEIYDPRTNRWSQRPPNADGTLGPRGGLVGQPSLCDRGLGRQR
jgi:N-acetylneuraminic acid mutarotase